MSTLKIKRENGKIFCPLADSWHIETPEEKVRQEYIKILVENYGYYISEVRRKIATLQLQIPLHSQRAKKEFEEAVFGEAQKRIY